MQDLYKNKPNTLTKDLNTDAFIREFAARTGFTLLDSRDILECYISIFSDACAGFFEINIPTWGHLVHRVIPARKGSKPKRGVIGEFEEMDYPETNRSTFKLSGNLKKISKG